MPFSVYEEPGDAEVVAIGYCRSRSITRYFWLGALDSRSAVRQIIFMCVHTETSSSSEKMHQCVIYTASQRQKS